MRERCGMLREGCGMVAGGVREGCGSGAKTGNAGGFVLLEVFWRLAPRC